MQKSEMRGPARSIGATPMGPLANGPLKVGGGPTGRKSRFGEATEFVRKTSNPWSCRYIVVEFAGFTPCAVEMKTVIEG